MMIAEKMYELGTKKSTIRTIFEYGRKRAAEVGEENIYDFSLGNPNVPSPECIRQAITDILTELDPCAVHGYTIAPGDPGVRETLAQSINRRFGTRFAGKNLFMTAGAAAAITITFKALSEPGDEFITFAPFFPEYRCFVESTGASLVVVPAQTSDFQIDFAAFAAALTPHTKAVIVNSPNNPSGVVYSEATIQRLTDMLRSKAAEFGHPIFLISDEPYREIAYAGVVVPYLTKYYADTIVCYSYSKSFSLRENVSAILSFRMRSRILERSMVRLPGRGGCLRMSTRRRFFSAWWQGAPMSHRILRLMKRMGGCSMMVSLLPALPAKSRRAPFISFLRPWRRMITPSANGQSNTTCCWCQGQISVVRAISGRPTASRPRLLKNPCRYLRNWPGNIFEFLAEIALHGNGRRKGKLRRLAPFRFVSEA